jgi:PilZ domain-containing protein
MSQTQIETRAITPPPLSALVLAGAEHSGLINKVLQSHGFAVHCAEDPARAQDICSQQRIDLAVYDQDVKGALDLARPLLSSSRPRVCIGLLRLNSSVHSPGLRLHFLVHKPFTGEILARTVKASYGPITADRRATFRHLVNIAAECNLLESGNVRSVSGVRILNLSRTGLCFQAPEMQQQGATIELTFKLPQMPVTVQLLGTVIWSHSSGRAGIKFSEFSSPDRQKLEEWHESALLDLHIPPLSPHGS